MSNARKLAANLPREGQLSGRNMVINGGFQVFQRASGVTTAPTGFQGYYSTADRWKIYSNTSGNYTTERSTDTPSGSGFSLKAVVTTAASSLSSSHYANFDHYIEAQNCQHLAYGTAAAKTLTLSFFVKSSKTGIYTVALYKPDTTAYMYTKEYTINSANTWEKKTITITPTAGGTSYITSSGGAIANDNGLGLALSFNQAFGSTFSGGTSDAWGLGSDWNYSTTNAVNWMDTVGNTFYLAEVQLEVGSSATPFEHEPYETAIRKCYRYYYTLRGTPNGKHVGSVVMRNNQYFYGYPRSFPAPMRVAPTFTYNDVSLYVGDNTNGFNTMTLAAAETDAFSFNGNAAGAVTAAETGHSGLLYLDINANRHVTFDAELSL